MSWPQQATNQNLGPVSLTVFFLQFKCDGNPPCCNSLTGHKIATNFCTCHDSTTVVPCAKLQNDNVVGIEVKAKRNFHRISIMMEKTLVKCTPNQFTDTHQLWINRPQCEKSIYHFWKLHRLKYLMFMISRPWFNRDVVLSIVRSSYLYNRNS